MDIQLLIIQVSSTICQLLETIHIIVQSFVFKAASKDYTAMPAHSIPVLCCLELDVRIVQMGLTYCPIIKAAKDVLKALLNEGIRMPLHARLARLVNTLISLEERTARAAGLEVTMIELLLVPAFPVLLGDSRMLLELPFVLHAQLEEQHRFKDPLQCQIVLYALLDTILPM
jgi:hypothetical protein